MNWIDYTILIVLALSILVGLWRGLVSEVLSLAGWIAAFWVAWTFGPLVAAQFEHSISLPVARIMVGYALCFVVVLIVGALLRFVARRLLWSTGLGGLDRLLGMLFGFARGVLLVTLAVFLASFTALTRESLWQQSLLLPQFTGAAGWLGDRVPANVRRYLHPPAQLPKLPPVTLPALPGGSPAPAQSVLSAVQAATLT
ncbi:CvpA family protein [Frateuria hangzhouensis]|uniref:CvpA family protein n=1 Tax=Frateuria hangzhouensis TaxID=2995589 RepID=UPI002260B872|nr:CvpA family protein [Frateuria sp. STR12]MCX7512491.1 CvpA family protein [Frateuria sp. STR12]